MKQQDGYTVRLQNNIGLVAILLMVAVFSPLSYGQVSCTVTETSSGNIGKNNQNDSYVYSTLASIDRVVSYVLKSGNTSCPSSAFRTSANILTVLNSRDFSYNCVAKVTVEGKKLGCTSEEATAQEGIAQAPLFLTQAIPPNVMYVLDDSGSMQFELMPDDIIAGDSRYIFPRANGIYGSSDYANNVPTVNNDSSLIKDNDPYNARSRSPQINTIYYNPSTTYYPWIKSDNSSYPQANPLCALHNPTRTTLLLTDKAYCRNLTVSDTNYNNNAWLSCKSDGSCSSTTNIKTYWPATYFWYKGSGSLWDWFSYKKVEIRFGATYSGDGRERRDDCVGASASAPFCTYTEEIQNFANWYTYYRSRVSMARAGSGFAFVDQSSGLRIGFGTINQPSTTVDGGDTSVIVKGVRKFAGTDRQAFYTSLYGGNIPTSGTPLRTAIAAVGTYYMRTDNKGPWGNTPGTNDTAAQLSCRRNYTVLMTDGYWSGSSVSGAGGSNNDGTDNPTHTSAAGKSYQYKAVSPFKDSRSDTLADVAMYYWKSDLRSDMPNTVAESKTNPAFWQHMVTFGVGLGVAGTIDPTAAFAAVKTGANIDWPNPTSADAHKIDDLLHAGVNSRGGFFSAAEPAKFANELSAVLETIASESKSSASSIAANSTRLDSGTLVYQASFNSLDWSGRIVAYNLNTNGSLKGVAWDSNTNSIASAATRNIVVGLGAPQTLVNSAISFTASNYDALSVSLQTALLAGGTVTTALDRLAWLRGDSSKEGVSLRQRSTTLGDIINSDPYFVDNLADYGFGILSGAEGSSYASYLSAKKSRTPMIYVGANDGMLHGFDALTGKEKFAYIPVASFPKLAALSDPNYVHSYTVDGSPRASDAYINGKWRTVLLGSMGAGGKSVFAIDVSDPAALSKNSFLWEKATSALDTHKLGVAMSEPVIARLQAEGKWVAIFGNGYASGDNVKLFVVDLATGAVLKAIDTGVTGVGNGLGTPVPVDVDNDRITDYVYAGDLKGNLWKFDFTGNSIASWSVAFKEGVIPKPLFQAVDNNGTAQPITVRPTVGAHKESGYMVYFGTGKYFEYADAVAGSSPQIQDFYGIRDAGVRVLNRSDLVTQTVVFEDYGTLSDTSKSAFSVRLVSNNSPSSAPAYGWRLRLLPPSGIAQGERSVSKPVLRNGRIIFTSIIPNNSSCGYGGRSWLMELDAQNGGRLNAPALDVNADGKVDELDKILFEGNYYPISGRGSEEMIKTPGIIGAGALEYKYTSGSSGSIGVVVESAGEGELLGRQSWRQFQ